MLCFLRYSTISTIYEKRFSFFQAGIPSDFDKICESFIKIHKVAFRLAVIKNFLVIELKLVLLSEIRIYFLENMYSMFRQLGLTLISLSEGLKIYFNIMSYALKSTNYERSWA